MKRAAYAGAGIAAALGLVHLGVLAFIIANRISYPFDIEWMEGGMLCHALRLLEGKPLYAPPSADFISYLYTPFYPFVLAALGKVFGLSYALGRILSVLSFAAVLILIFRVVQKEIADRWLARLWGIAAIGLVASSFPLVGAWYDLVRNDSLYLALITSGLFLLRYHHRSWLALVGAGVFAGLAFLTKQTASLFIVFSGIALLIMNWRRLPLYVATVGIVAGGGVLALNHFTGGWFWKYAFAMHQSHDLYWDRIWPTTEIHLFRSMPIVGALLGIWLTVRLLCGLRRRRIGLMSGDPLYWFGVALVGVLVSAVGFSTQWASENAYIPGFIFPSLFAILAAADWTQKSASLLNVGPQSTHDAHAKTCAKNNLSNAAFFKRASFRSMLCGGISLLCGGALATQMLLQLYKPSPHIPTSADRRAGQKLIETLRQIDGPVLMPYHPYYPVRAGKKASYHQMGINDVTRAGYPFPADLIERIMSRHYGALLFDNSPRGRYDFIFGPYKLQTFFSPGEMPRVRTGYDVHPTYLFLPKKIDPVPPGTKRVLDFETGSYTNWEIEGSAFGLSPAGGPLWDQGPVGPFEGSFLANSYSGGDNSTGILRSKEFTLDRPFISYRVGGGNLPGKISIRFFGAGQMIHEGTGPGTDIMVLRRVDVRAYQGQAIRVLLIDHAQESWGHLLFDDLMLRDN